MCSELVKGNGCSTSAPLRALTISSEMIRLRGGVAKSWNSADFCNSCRLKQASEGLADSFSRMLDAFGLRK
jgi:hypothetical protein